MGIQIPCLLGDTKNTEGVPKSLGDLTRGCQILGGAGSPMTPALSGRHYSVDWTTGLDYWTHGNCLWRRKEQDYTEIHTAIQESRVIFHRSQHVVLNSVRSWCKCAIKNWSQNPGNASNPSFPFQRQSPERKWITIRDEQRVPHSAFITKKSDVKEQDCSKDK